MTKEPQRQSSAGGDVGVRREIEAGLADSDEGRTRPVEEIMRSFGIAE